MVNVLRRLLRSILESEAARYRVERNEALARAESAEVQLAMLASLRVGSKLERIPSGWRAHAITDHGHVAVGNGPTASLAVHHSGA